MFYQIFLSPQVKRCAIITYKHGIFEMPQGLRKLGNFRKVSKLHKNDNLVASLPAKKKILLILAKNS